MRLMSAPKARALSLETALKAHDGSLKIHEELIEKTGEKLQKEYAGHASEIANKYAICGVQKGVGRSRKADKPSY